MHVKDKVVVITGGASGIGKGLAKRFVADGARQVVIADINEDMLNQVAEELGVRAVPTNVADEQQVINLVRTAEKDYGQIDLMCNNAGIMVAGDEQTANDDWQRIWDINVMAHVYGTRAALPAMLARGEGYFLNTASAAGLLSQIVAASYAVTKHAAIGYSEWLAITYGDRGIRVSVLCPQAVRTGMASEFGVSVAGLDGTLEPSDVAESVSQTLAEETFLVLPHPEVETYMKRKTADYDRWLGGMRRLQARTYAARDAAND
jgi:NAD(P)-dependent dehydrogenase (short-subunit alcohol dehydrogenase family)